MKNEIFDNMLSRYDLTTEQQKRNAIFEVNQQVILAGLYAGGFFESAAFYGGTCLRIFHGLQRFSEDMDFSLLTQDDKFDFTKYFPAIVDAFTMVGREVEIKKKDKRNFGKVESAFLKDNTDVYDVTFQTEKSIKIKIEVDTCPPLNFKTEQKLLLQPYSFMTRCFTLPDLFAGKMHALVYRAWKNRVKGRDWYDFEWYVRHNVPLYFTHLAERCKQFSNENITPELFKEKLIERLSTADIKQVKEDVLPFVRNPEELDSWSNDYFGQLRQRVIQPRRVDGGIKIEIFYPQLAFHFGTVWPQFQMKPWDHPLHITVAFQRAVNVHFVLFDVTGQLQFWYLHLPGAAVQATAGFNQAIEFRRPLRELFGGVNAVKR